MATLIQSKQIQGIVTASVVEGEFSVSGSLVVTGSQIVLGPVSATSFIGDGSGLTGISYSQLGDTPQFIGGNNVTITSASNVITINTSLNGALSGSSQVLGGSGILSSSNETFTELSSSIDTRLINLETYSASLDSQFLNTNGDNVVSGSSQITISDASGFNTFSSSIAAEFDAIVHTQIPEGTVSSSQQVTDLLPSGVVSGSSQITITESQISDLTHTNIDSLNQFTSSIQTQVDSLTSTTSSYLTELPSGLVSSSLQAGSGIVLTQVGDVITITNTGGSGGDTVSDAAAIAQLNAYTASTDIRISNIEQSTTSLQSQLGVIGSSLFSELTDLSSSVATTIDSIVHTQIPQGTISSSQQISDLGFVTSSGASGEHTDISHLNLFTSSVQTEIDGLSAQTASYLTELPSGLVSGSYVESLPSGLVSSSEQVLGGSGILSGSHTDISSLNDFTSSYLTDSASFDTRISSIGGHVNIGNLNTFTQSAESRLSQLESATGSYLTSETDNQTLTIVGDQLTISSGNTITIPTGSNVTLPSGLISSSDQVLGGTGILSGSHTDITLLNTFSGSIQSQVDELILSSSTFITSETDSQTLTIVGDQLTISDGNTITIPTGSGDTGTDISFDGNREVTNTLLGDLFVESFNAGTSGSIQDFLNEMFFPSYAPTATFTNQTGNWNENLATDGTNLVSISVSDTVDDSPYVVTLSGANASSFIPTPTNAASSSWELRADGNLTAGTYTYDVIVTDKNSASRTYSSRTIVVDDANLGTLSTTGTLYIIESATSGPIYLGSNGRSGAQGGVSVTYSPNYGSQYARTFASTNPLISIDSTTGVLSVGSPISGSGNLAGSTITSTIAWLDQYNNTNLSDITVNVTQNTAPDIQFSNSSRLNTNQAVNGGGTLVTISFSDTEGDSINHDSFQFTDTSGQLTATRSGNTYLVTANSNLSGSTNYTIGATIEDVHGFRSNTESHTFTITQSGNGTISGDTTIYIIESALTGDSFRDATGFGNGNTADVNVTYSPSAGSQVVSSFSSSNPVILINSSGNMTLGVDLSGSITQSGATIETLITFQDQYGNIGSGSVTANVFGNLAPSVSFVATSDYDTDNALANSNAGVITISDTESNSPYNVTLSGTDAASFNVVPQNAISSSWQVQPKSSLTANTYSIDIITTDNYGEVSTLSNKSIVVNEVLSGGTVYVYNVGQQANNIEYNVGILSTDSSTPPAITPFNGVGFIEQIIAGNLGNSSFTYSWGETKTATLAASGNGSDVHSVLRTMGDISYTNSNAFVIIIPTDLGMSGVPTSMTDGYGDNTLGRYVLEVGLNGGTPDGINTIEPSTIYSVTLGSDVNGTRNYYVISTNNAIAPSTSLNFALNPASGSGGV